MDISFFATVVSRWLATAALALAWLPAAAQFGLTEDPAFALKKNEQDKAAFEAVQRQLSWTSVKGVDGAYAGPVVEIGFSPRGGAHDLVGRALRSAKKEIDLAGYEFSAPDLAHALIEAQERGVVVFVVLDEKENAGKPYSKFRELQRSGIAVRLNARYPIMHNKFAVIDGESVQMGSFNYTAAAERKNAENAAWIHDETVARFYREEFMRLWAESGEE